VGLHERRLGGRRLVHHGDGIGGRWLVLAGQQYEAAYQQAHRHDGAT
jgi:hypothetical protein